MFTINQIFIDILLLYYGGSNKNADEVVFKALVGMHLGHVHV